MIDKIQQLKKIKNRYEHHTTEADKIPAITRDLNFHYLDWLYDDNKINVRAKDYTLIALIQKVIDIYLEEEN